MPSVQCQSAPCDSTAIPTSHVGLPLHNTRQTSFLFPFATSLFLYLILLIYNELGLYANSLSSLLEELVGFNGINMSSVIVLIMVSLK